MIVENTTASIAEPKAKIAYTVAEAAEAVSMSKSYLRNEIRAKKLKAKLIGNRVLIGVADLQMWFAGKSDWQGINDRNN